MRILLFTITAALWLAGNFNATAQETTPETKTEMNEGILEQIADLRTDKEDLIQDEKDELRKAVAKINTRLENNEISATEAAQLKVQAAEKHALNIENKAAIIENRIALLERNGEDDNRFILSFSLRNNNTSKKVRSHTKSLRTYGGITFAIGLNNTIIEGQPLDDSPYKIGGSRFMEIGGTWSTRVFENSNVLRLTYGFSFQFNGLKMEDNTYLVDNGDGTTSLQEFPEQLDKAKFRMDNLVIPVHFEFGSNNSDVRDGKNYYMSSHGFKVGLGGYAGINLSTLQKLKYDKNDGDVKEKRRESYNTNNFIYGLSGYIGWNDMSLYAKYDLNPIFDAPNVEQRNISLGLRWDWY
tara:strand:- start:244 stop:1305 length:1062 start_codon:yes stop_codon:yes gene_type:complete